MRIERVDVFTVRMPLKAIVTLSRGPSRSFEEGKQVVMVRMTGEDGNVGWGESGPSRRWSAETTESCYSTIRNYLAPLAIGHSVFDIAGLHRRMNQELAPGLDPGQPVAKNAIDVAAHDLLCKHLGIPLNAWLGSTEQTEVPLARLVSAASPEDAAEIVTSGLAEGYRGFKVKVGADIAKDVAILRAVVETAGDAEVWPDANQGYTLEDAFRMCRELERLDLTLFEQPIPMTQIEGCRRLVDGTPVTIALDESAMGVPFALELLRRGALEGMAIKVNKCGGIYHARQMCDLARNAGLKLIGSGLMDAPIGFAASIHLFAAYGIDLPVDLNGPQHIKEDYTATPYPVERQVAKVTTVPGHGAEVDQARVDAMAIALDL